MTDEADMCQMLELWVPQINITAGRKKVSVPGAYTSPDLRNSLNTMSPRLSLTFQ